MQYAKSKLHQADSGQIWTTSKISEARLLEWTVLSNSQLNFNKISGIKICRSTHPDEWRVRKSNHLDFDLLLSDRFMKRYLVASRCCVSPGGSHRHGRTAQHLRSGPFFFFLAPSWDTTNFFSGFFFFCFSSVTCLSCLLLLMLVAAWLLFACNLQTPFLVALPLVHYSIRFAALLELVDFDLILLLCYICQCSVVWALPVHGHFKNDAHFEL